MSRQQSAAPDEPEEARPKAKVKKEKPWSVWHQWNRWGWSRVGRYQTKEEAEKVIAKNVRQYGNGKIYSWAPGTYRLMHDQDGKPK
jgi:hypothetical protein